MMSKSHNHFFLLPPDASTRSPTTLDQASSSASKYIHHSPLYEKLRFHNHATEHTLCFPALTAEGSAEDPLSEEGTNLGCFLNPCGHVTTK